ncbi:Hypothetical predicted protein [Octopus vulgaris]|uniref:Protein kish n=1 Tax=Octopus vulgaris TaxID=6645 RepID=A0AA36FJ34_OCTVU|nr:Hypothetical predicted protein [Octopus vulgaris]
MSALFNFQSLLTVVLLVICTCTYLRAFFPALLDKNKQGFLGTFWKCARIDPADAYLRLLHSREETNLLESYF